VHLFIFGLLLGWGVAIPFGPINLEISRRNLLQGTAEGTIFGLGACLADVSYLILLSFGALALFTHTAILRAIGILGSLVLIWFAIQALKNKEEQTSAPLKKRSLWGHLIAGYAMTLLNPYNVLFWSSLIAQIAVVAEAKSFGVLIAGSGVLVGALSWVLFLNFLLHLTRHKLPKKIIQSLNLAGVVILFGFALFGLVRALFFM